MNAAQNGNTICADGAAIIFIHQNSYMSGVSYTIGKATVYGGYSAMQWDDIALNARVYGSSAKYQFNATNSLALGYAILRDQTSQDNNADQFVLLYEYDVSKCTNVYGAMSFLRNRNAANPGLPLAYPGADARSVQVGIVHRF